MLLLLFYGGMRNATVKIVEIFHSLVDNYLFALFLKKDIFDVGSYAGKSAAQELIDKPLYTNVSLCIRTMLLLEEKKVLVNIKKNCDGILKTPTLKKRIHYSKAVIPNVTMLRVTRALPNHRRLEIEQAEKL